MFNPILLAANTLAAGSEENPATLAQKIASFFEYFLGQIPSWIAGFVVFILSIFIAKMAKSAVEARISDQVDEEHQEVLVLSGRVTYFGILTLGITIALKIAGIDLTTILAAVAFGIGFALQDLIMNFLAGVMILLSRQFTIGDFIKVGNTIGKVVEIQTRATILKAVDGTKVIVPNSEIFTNQVVSMTSNPMRRVVVPIYVSYDTDVNFAMKTAMLVLENHPKIQKKPKPTIVFSGYGDSSIDLSARFWVGSRDGWFKVKSEIMQQMLEAFNKAKIEIPYNIVHIETSQDAAALAAANPQITAAQEMAASEAIANDAPPAVMPASAQLAAETVPTQPTAEYQDQEEIDGQA